MEQASKCFYIHVCGMYSVSHFNVSTTLKYTLVYSLYLQTYYICIRNCPLFLAIHIYFYICIQLWNEVFNYIFLFHSQGKIRQLKKEAEMYNMQMCEMKEELLECKTKIASLATSPYWIPPYEQKMIRDYTKKQETLQVSMVACIWLYVQCQYVGSHKIVYNMVGCYMIVQ